MATLIVTGCTKKERIHPKLSAITESVYASGIVKAVDQYKVYAEANGILQKKNISRGDLVKQDQPLFLIENKTSGLNTENNRIAVDLTRENLNKITDQKRETALLKKIFLQDSLMYTRQQKLWKQNVGTKLELEQRMIAYQTSKTNFLNSLNKTAQATKEYDLELERAKNNFQISKEMEADYIVRSRTDGKVYNILIEEGESVTPQTPLALVGKPDQFLIEMQVDENDIIKVKAGQTIFISMESYQDHVFKARVTIIHPVMNEETGTFTVEGVLNNTPQTLYPNLNLEANILIRRKNKAMVIPRDYLLNEEYVLIEPGKKVKVKVGLKNYEYVEIVEGLHFDQYIYKP